MLLKHTHETNYKEVFYKYFCLSPICIILLKHTRASFESQISTKPYSTRSDFSIHSARFRTSKFLFQAKLRDSDEVTSTFGPTEIQNRYAVLGSFPIQPPPPPVHEVIAPIVIYIFFTLMGGLRYKTTIGGGYNGQYPCSVWTSDFFSVFIRATHPILITLLLFQWACSLETGTKCQERIRRLRRLSTDTCSDSVEVVVALMAPTPPSLRLKTPLLLGSKPHTSSSLFMTLTKLVHSVSTNTCLFRTRLAEVAWYTNQDVWLPLLSDKEVLGFQWCLWPLITNCLLLYKLLQYSFVILWENWHVRCGV